MKIYQQLKNYNLILATNSPRRHQFFKDLHLDFQVKTYPIEESYPSDLKGSQITDFIAQKKASPFAKELTPKDILITCDTLIWIDNQAIGKPNSYNEARDILHLLSGKTHEVISSVCISSFAYEQTINETTFVTFKTLNNDEIDFYINQYQPFDKAGSYGIQEWIGLIGISHIEGSYNNVVGLPTHRIFEIIEKLINSQSKI